MGKDKLNPATPHLNVQVCNSEFHFQVFSWVYKHQKSSLNKNGADLLFASTNEYLEFSRRLDLSKLQDSCSVRNILRARELALHLIDEKGELKTQALAELISHLSQNLYSLGPNRYEDSKRQEHVVHVLRLLASTKELYRIVKKATRPLSNKIAEEVIRDTLNLPATTIVTDIYTRQAILAAWLSTLRQNVGSCFATAPAILVHDEQPELFLQDLVDLIATGRLKRTFGGIEHSVPISSSWGNGDLRRPIIMQKTNQGMTPEVWLSPGLLYALEESGVLDKKEEKRHSTEFIRNSIFSFIAPKEKTAPYILTNAEEILRYILLKENQITENQLQEYQNRPRPMIQNNLMIQVPRQLKTKTTAVGDRCSRFQVQFEIAKNTFKGIADNALLKTWEFTLASFAETKFEFAKWNLYASLGMKTDEPGGIGQCIYQTVQGKLDEAQRKTEELKPEYDMLYTQLKMIESRVRHASTEKELNWLRMEYQTHLSEFRMIEEVWEDAKERSQNLVNLYETLYKLYIDLFKEYFQEVYDADMQEVTTGPFDDSPAGFRLLYKHGRSNTSHWTRVRNLADYVESLAAFFTATEPQISSALRDKKMEKDLGEIVTGIIVHVKTTEFLESALYRMAKAHQSYLPKNPLEHLDKVEKKPWAYTSGGTMDSLVSSYFRIEGKPQEVTKWIENETELLVFISDVLKQIPANQMDVFLKKKKSSILMQSPTHAFILKPVADPFIHAWMEDQFTYTHVRDTFIIPAETFIRTLYLSSEEIAFLIRKLSEKIPLNYQPRFKTVFSLLKGPLNPINFKEVLVDWTERDAGLTHGTRSVLAYDEVDALLYRLLPLFRASELKNRLSQLFILIPGFHTDHIQEMLTLLDQFPSTDPDEILSSIQLQEIAEALLCLSLRTTTTSVNYSLLITRTAQELGFALKAPIIFADTNWVKDMFGFVVNPGTGQYELWRLDDLGRKGYPMTEWKKWVDGSQPQARWGVYTKPFEFGQI